MGEMRGGEIEGRGREGRGHRRGGEGVGKGRGDYSKIVIGGVLVPA